MGGGYISCGEWLGDDKSGSAFLSLLDELEQTLLPEETSRWQEMVGEPLQEQLNDTPEDDMPYLELDRAMMDCLIGPVRRYVAQERARGIRGDPPGTVEDGWQSGPEWRLYCAIDLLRAHDECSRTGDTVVIHFD